MRSLHMRIALIVVVLAWRTIALAAPPDASAGKTAMPPQVGKIGCDDRLFIDDPQLRWEDRSVAPASGMDGIRRAIDRSDRSKPTRIRVAAGTYRGQCLNLEDHVRTAQAPLWLRAEGTVQIECSDGNGQAFGFVHVAYLAIEGFTFGPERGNYGDSGIHVSGRPVAPRDPKSYGIWQPSHHVVIRNNTMRNLHRGADGDANPDHYESGCCDGAKANQTEWIWYVGNTISRTARHGIDNVGVHHAAICNNTFRDLVGEGQGVEAKGGAYDIVIEANRFDRVFHRAIMLGGEGTNNNFMWPVDFPAEAYGVVARNNVIVDAAEGGVTFYGCWSCSAVHNTVVFTAGKRAHAHDFLRMYPSTLEGGTYDEWGAARRVDERLGNRDATVAFNVFSAPGGDLACPLDASNDGLGTRGLRIHDNVFWNGGRPLPECGEGTNSLAGFPRAGRIVDPRLGPDLAPMAGSPLIGAVARSVPLDARRNPRAERAAIGAFEPR